jgi:hypothetical protein
MFGVRVGRHPGTTVGGENLVARPDGERNNIFGSLARAPRQARQVRIACCARHWPWPRHSCDQQAGTADQQAGMAARRLGGTDDLGPLRGIDTLPLSLQSAILARPRMPNKLTLVLFGVVFIVWPSVVILEVFWKCAVFLHRRCHSRFAP